jgi:hypothetical protein
MERRFMLVVQRIVVSSSSASRTDITLRNKPFGYLQNRQDQSDGDTFQLLLGLIPEHRPGLLIESQNPDLTIKS